uniref:Secretory carrier-associated membrane protein n=1 Tax=Cyprinus carpio TaxID=7962 RepID=A0A8C1W0I7_CYPCA
NLAPLSFKDGRTIPVSTASQPAVLQTTVEPSPQASVTAGQAELLRQQAELEKKAAELERKEQELRDRNTALGKENNWPPLPKFFPIKPCFYQDFNEEIPVEYQRVCKMMYYLWIYHSVTLFLNLLACLVYFTVSTQNGVDFGLSILWFILFTPVAFLCWYRPVYKAFKSDSSFSFFFFFFIFSFQVIVYIIQSVGIPGWGNSGWITAISVIKINIAVSVFMMVVAGFFTGSAVLSVILLKMVSCQNCEFVSRNSEKKSQNFELVSHNSEKKSRNCEFVSCSSEKKVIIASLYDIILRKKVGIVSLSHAVLKKKSELRVCITQF